MAYFPDTKRLRQPVQRRRMAAPQPALTANGLPNVEARGMITAPIYRPMAPQGGQPNHPALQVPSWAGGAPGPAQSPQVPGWAQGPVGPAQQAPPRMDPGQPFAPGYGHQPNQPPGTPGGGSPIPRDPGTPFAPGHGHQLQPGDPGYVQAQLQAMGLSQDGTFIGQTRTLNDQLQALLAQLQAQQGAIQPQLDLNLARLGTDQTQQTDATGSDLAGRGIFSGAGGAGGSVLNDLLNQFGRQRQDYASAAQQQFGDVANQESGANLTYEQGLMQALQDLAQRQALDPKHSPASKKSPKKGK